MNWFDLALIILVAVSVTSGVLRGFSRTGFGFLAVVVAFLAAAWLYPVNPAGFLIGFVVLICLGAVGAFLLGKWIRTDGPRWLDGVLGAAFGLANALLFSVFAVLALMAFAPRFAREHIARSTFAPYAFEAACIVAEVVPDEMKSNVERSYKELGDVLPARFRKAMPPLPSNEI